MGKQAQSIGSDRKQRRHSLVRFVWYRPLDRDGAKREGVARSCDLSLSGIGIYTTRPLEPGTSVFVEIAAREFNLSAVGEVAHCTAAGDTFRVGIAFVVLPPNDRALLRQLCASED
jgi:hypothetical protein